MKTTNIANAIGGRTSRPRISNQVEVAHELIASIHFNYRWLTAILVLLSVVNVLAAPFNSGSTGAYGPMNITSNTTLAMPADGIFHCTTIDITNGATLLFTKNALNTPVY